MCKSNVIPLFPQCFSDKSQHIFGEWGDFFGENRCLKWKTVVKCSSIFLKGGLNSQKFHNKPQSSSVFRAKVLSLPFKQ